MADDRLRQALAAAKLRSGEADRAYTGGTGPEVLPDHNLAVGLLKSALSGGRSNLESLLGMPGDYPAVAFPLANATTGFRLPTGAEIGQFTDRHSPQWLQDWTRYQSQGPVEESYNFLGQQAFDPTNYLGAGAFAKARKFIP